MEDKTIIGKVVKKMNNYVVVEEETGKEYKLYAIKPMEAVSPDFDIGKFEKFVDKKVEASGMFENGSIWDAYLVEVK